MDILWKIDENPFQVYSPGRSFSLPAVPLSQIDLVPTVSLLLGVPIPFSNLGVVIRDLFPEQLQNLAIELNYEQIIRYRNPVLFI